MPEVIDCPFVLVIRKLLWLPFCLLKFALPSPVFCLDEIG